MTFTPEGAAISELRTRGFIGDFVIDTDAIPPGIRCRTCGRGQFAERALLVEVSAASSRSATGCEPIVLGIACPRCTTTGVLVIPDGADGSDAEREVIRVLCDRANDAASHARPTGP